MFNLVACDKEKSHTKLTAELIRWYSKSEMPSQRCDVISKYKNQYQEAPDSPLCHVSVSSWILKANSKYDAPERKERCSKVTADVVYQAVVMLNDFAENKYTLIAANLTQETSDCMTCHGKEGDFNVTVQQNCLSCHDDHTK